MRKIIPLLSALILFFCMTFVFAKGHQNQNVIQLYEKPDTASSVIATVKPDSSLITIFQKDEWLKVANPSNGDVGWTRRADLQAASAPLIYVHTYRKKTDKNGDNGYYVIQYTGTQNLSKKQIETLIKHAKKQQEATRKTMEHFTEESIKEMARFDKELTDPEFFHINIPVQQPIIIVPESDSSLPKEK